MRYMYYACVVCPLCTFDCVPKAFLNFYSYLFGV